MLSFIDTEFFVMLYYVILCLLLIRVCYSLLCLNILYYVFSYLKSMFFVVFLRYLKRGLIIYSNQSSIKPSFYFSSIVNQIRSRNQPVLINRGKVSCSKKQRGPMMGLESTTSTLRVRRATHCATPLCNAVLCCYAWCSAVLQDNLSE